MALLLYIYCLLWLGFLCCIHNPGERWNQADVDRVVQPPRQQRRQEPLCAAAVPLEGDQQVQRGGRHGGLEQDALQGGRAPGPRRESCGLSGCLSSIYMSIYLSIYFMIYLFHLFLLSINLLYLYISLSLCITYVMYLTKSIFSLLSLFHLSICQPVYLSVYIYNAVPPRMGLRLIRRVSIFFIRLLARFRTDSSRGPSIVLFYFVWFLFALLRQVVIKYVPYVGDSKRALDEYTSEIFMGGKNTISMHNTCEDSLLASPLIFDLVIMAELCERIQVMIFCSFFFFCASIRSSSCSLCRLVLMVWCDVVIWCISIPFHRISLSPSLLLGFVCMFWLKLIVVSILSIVCRLKGVVVSLVAIFFIAWPTAANFTGEIKNQSQIKPLSILRSFCTSIPNHLWMILLLHIYIHVYIYMWHFSPHGMVGSVFIYLLSEKSDATASRSFVRWSSRCPAVCLFVCLSAPSPPPAPSPVH